MLNYIVLFTVAMQKSQAVAGAESQQDAFARAIMLLM